MKWAWAIGEVLILAILIREWISIRRELKRDAVQREAAHSRNGTVASGPARHTKGQHELDEGVTEARE